MYAIYDECSHAAVALSEGDVEGCRDRVLAARLASSTCAPASRSACPATEPVAIYPVRVEGDDVLVDVHSPY